jgi:hypothetical protein
MIHPLRLIKLSVHVKKLQLKSRLIMIQAFRLYAPSDERGQGINLVHVSGIEELPFYLNLSLGLVLCPTPRLRAVLARELIRPSEKVLHCSHRFLQREYPCLWFQDKREHPES